MRKTRIALIIFIVVIILACFFIFINFDNEQDEFGVPEITVFDTRKKTATDEYQKEISFFRGDKIYVYQKYNNVTHHGESDFYLNLSVYDSQRNLHFYYEENVKEVETGCYYFFTTNSSWLTDAYIVFSYLEDHISNLNTSAVTTFFLN